MGLFLSSSHGKAYCSFSIHHENRYMLLCILNLFLLIFHRVFPCSVTQIYGYQVHMQYIMPFLNTVSFHYIFFLFSFLKWRFLNSSVGLIQWDFWELSASFHNYALLIGISNKLLKCGEEGRTLASMPLHSPLSQTGPTLD